MIKNDDKLQKKLCEHLCAKILMGDIGQKDSSSQVNEQDFSSNIKD